MGPSSLHTKHLLKAFFILAPIIIGATFFSVVFAVSGDTVPPTIPTGLVIYSLTSTEVKLRWTASTDDIGVVAGYHLYRGGRPMVEIGTASTLDYTDTTMTPGTGYYYAVAAFDDAGNVSSSSAEVFVNIPLANTKPDAPVLSGSASANAAILNWTESSTGVSGFKLYKIISGLWTDIGNVSGGGTSYTDNGLAAGSYSYKVQAFNSTNGMIDYSPTSNIVMVTIGAPADTTAPTAPTSLTAVANSSSRIDLSFSASTDDVGVVGYKIFRVTSGTNIAGGVATTFLASVTGHSFSDINLSPSTTYYYAVKAFDAAGNESALSNTTSATTAVLASNIATSTGDTTAPTISFIQASGILDADAQIYWTTDDLSDSRVDFGTSPSAATLYSRNSNSRCDGGGNVTSHCVNLANLYPGTAYYYRVISRNTEGLETTSSEQHFITQSSALITATSSPQILTPIMVSVTKGTAYCEGLSASNPVIFYGSLSSGVNFSVAKVGATAPETVSPGTRVLSNGSYLWKAIPAPGYVISGADQGTFVLDKICGTTLTSATTSPVTSAASVILLGDTLVHVPYGGLFVDPGAKGTMNGGTVVPQRLLGEYKSSIPGTYVIRYEIVGAGGMVLASATRTVIVDDGPATTSTAGITQETETLVPSPSNPSQPPLSALPPPVTPEPPALSAADIVSPVQYNDYCDDPLHKAECRTFATTQVSAARTPTFEIPATQGGTSIISKAFSLLEQQHTPLPGGVTSEQQLRAVCSQSQYAPTCSEFLVTLKLATREEEDHHLREFLAAKAESEKMITERVGARMFQDSDGDGITDYDEVNLYGTDPFQRDSNYNGISDGDELLAGTDPSAPMPAMQTSTSSSPGTSTLLVLLGKANKATTTARRINFEDVKVAGDEKPKLLAVTTVNTTPLEQQNGSTTKTALFLAGHALPNSFVTLYIYSDPVVVTVKADAAGEWTYTMDRELPDGSHQVYSAITDSGGRILAKSEPLPFVKEAAAVTLGAALLPASPEAPGFFSGVSLYAMIAVLIVVLGGSFSLIGFIVRRNDASRIGGSKDGESDVLP